MYPNGTTFIVAGTAGVSGASGSGVSGTSALLSYPRGLSPGPASSSDIVIADSYVPVLAHFYLFSRATLSPTFEQRRSRYPHPLCQWNPEHARWDPGRLGLCERPRDLRTVQPASHGLIRCAAYSRCRTAIITVSCDPRLIRGLCLASQMVLAASTFQTSEATSYNEFWLIELSSQRVSRECNSVYRHRLRYTFMRAMNIPAGTLFGYLGDGGTPLRARMHYPQATYWDGTTLWIVDNGNAALRAVLPPQQVRKAAACNMAPATLPLLLSSSSRSVFPLVRRSWLAARSPLEAAPDPLSVASRGLHRRVLGEPQSRIPRRL